MTVVLRTAGAILPVPILTEAPMDLATHHSAMREMLVEVVEEDAAAINEMLTNASKQRSAQACCAV